MLFFDVRPFITLIVLNLCEFFRHFDSVKQWFRQCCWVPFNGMSLGFNQGPAAKREIVDYLYALELHKIKFESYSIFFFFSFICVTYVFHNQDESLRKKKKATKKKSAS